MKKVWKYFFFFYLGVIIIGKEVENEKNIWKTRRIKMYRCFNGIEQGIKTGIEEGAKEEKIQIAKKMLKEKVSIEFIIKVTGLSKEEVEQLISD